MKLLKNLLKQPSFVFGGGLFIVTMLIALLGPIVTEINTNSDFMPYQAPNSPIMAELSVQGKWNFVATKKYDNSINAVITILNNGNTVTVQNKLALKDASPNGVVVIPTAVLLAGTKYADKKEVRITQVVVGKVGWLGTDHLGRDMVSLLIKGLRASLYVGFIAGILATLLGTFLGVYAGYKGGWLDDIVNMVTNLFLVIPSFVVLLLISASLKDGRSLELIAIIIGLTTWTWTTRSVRAQTASLKGSEHINLAKVNGANTFVILTKHILPYLLSYVFMVFIIQIASGILQEASISMLGLGPYDSISLGNILNDAMHNEALGDGVWWAFMPGSFLITAVVFALYTLNTSMEGVFNPALRK